MPLIRPEARGAHLRTLLSRLRDAAPELSAKVATAIARSDLGEGIPERAQILSDDPDDGDELKNQTDAQNTSYGAEIIGPDWSSSSRGAALLYYLRAHRELVSGKEVLHVAPEAEARVWLSGVCRYTTLDGMPDIAPDIVADITNLPQSDASFDVVICHRVLEHVLDDRSAMREFARVLRPGGLLNISVPQAMHRDSTAEWLVQDESHHGHVEYWRAGT